MSRRLTSTCSCREELKTLEEAVCVYLQKEGNATVVYIDHVSVSPGIGDRFAFKTLRRVQPPSEGGAEVTLTAEQNDMNANDFCGSVFIFIFI